MLARWRDDDVFAESLRRPRKARRVGLLRGSADRQRPARASTTCGPGCSRTSTPASTRCGASTSPARAAGTATACRSRSRSRRSSASRASTRSRTSASSAFNQRVPRVGAALRRGLAVAHQPRSACGSTPPTRTGRCRTSTSRACGGCSARCGTRACIYEGYKVVPVLRALRHRAVEPRARPARRVPRRHRAVGLRALPARRAADVDLLVWTTTPWTLVVERRAPRSGPTSTTCACARPRAGATSCMAAARVERRVRRRRRGRRPRRRSPTSSALRYERRSTVAAGSTATRWRGRRRRLRDHRRRLGHRAPRARVRRDRPRGRPSARACPMLNPVERRGALRPRAVPPYAGQVREGRRPATHRRPRRARAARARASTTRTRTRTAGAATRRSSTGPRPTWFARTSAHKARAARARTRRSTGTPSTSSTGASATGSRTTSTGRCRATATGARRSRCGAATTAATTLRRLGGRARRELAGRDLTEPRPAPARTSTTSRSRARSATAARARRVEPVLDAWFDSGSMPPRSSTTRSRTPTRSSTRFPADFICEAIDQTRGWFYSLLAVNTLVFDRTPYRNVVCLGATSSTRTARRCRSRRAT